jgi:hypothetical protein
MMAWFKRQPPAEPTIGSLQFETATWKYLSERELAKVRVWETPEHDAVLLYFFKVAPDLPLINSARELRNFYSAQLRGSKMAVVECGIELVGKRPSVRLVIKVPQEQHGMLYQGSFTVPFKNFSFVIRVQCAETGMTGMREAILTERRLRAGEVPNHEGSGPLFLGWDPDSPSFDAEFPAHPVSRVRRLLAHIAKSATLEESVRGLEHFPLPSGG